MEVEAAILAALRPQGTRERVLQIVARGWTAVQVCERLPDAVRNALAGEATGPVADRRAINAVHQVLLRLVEEKRVRRRRASYSMFLNTKGERTMLVDLYSISA